MKDKKQPRLILLDAHAILHRAYHALPDFSSSKGEPTGALYGIATMLIKIIQDLKPDYIVACYDLPQPTHRHEAYAEYKAGRQKADEELIAQIIRSRDVFTAFGVPMYDKVGFEADDILGTIVEMLKDEPVDIVIASGDMDTLQLVKDKKVQVYTLKKGINDTIMYDEEAVVARFGFVPLLLPDYKGLRGDPSDNIIGIKGIGEKTASILIQNFETIEKMYKVLKKNPEKFGEVGISPRVIELLRAGEEEAQFSKTLATIRRDAPIDFKMPEKLWKETFDYAKIAELFATLEFRTLGDRVKKAVYGEPVQSSMLGGGAVGEGSGTGSGAEGGAVSTLAPAPAEIVDPTEFKKVALAAWILDSNLTNPSVEDVMQFAKAKNFVEAREKILADVAKSGAKKVYEEIELPLTPILESAEGKGVKIDVEYLKKLSKEYHVELEKYQKKIYELADGEFNVNSPKQLGEVLFDKLQIKVKNQKKTAGGARSTRESELEKMREVHPIIDEILKYRELQKLLSTYIDTIPLMVDGEKRLHTTFVQTGTTTGRLSSQNPNLQNIPIKSELGRAIRNGFVAEKGTVLATFDYSQIELRIAAFLSKDQTLIDIFKNGRDVHTEVASKVFNVPAERVDKEMRRKAKVINFGIIYGMGVNALRQNLGTDRAEAQKFYEEYFATFSTLASYLESVKTAAAKNGFTETFFGRRRSFEGIRSKIPYIRAAAERMAINAPIQGTGADILKIAMIKIDEYIEKNNLRDSVSLLLQVHDELIYEIKKEKVAEIAPQIRKIMENIIKPADIFGVPLLSSSSVGSSWGTTEAMQ
jgi:DNA polymerase-1